MTEVRKQFKALDVNNDNCLSFEEISTLLKKLSPSFSENQLQQLFCGIDVDRNGTVDFDEFFSFISDGKKAQPKIPIEAPLAKPSASGVREEWKQETLDAHNKLRKDHGAQELTWSDECYLEAKTQADACQAKSSLFHGCLSGPSGRHGQNAYWCSAPGSTAEQCTQSWYDEVDDPGYDFKKPGFGYGTGHFTQVVWRGTQKVGMAASEDGCFVVANYFPAGNMQGAFEQQVLPRGGSAPAKAEPKAKAKAKAKAVPKKDEGAGGLEGLTAMTSELEASLDRCPFPQFKEKAIQTFSQGGNVSVKEETDGRKTTMVVTLKNG